MLENYGQVLMDVQLKVTAKHNQEPWKLIMSSISILLQHLHVASHVPVGKCGASVQMEASYLREGLISPPAEEFVEKKKKKKKKKEKEEVEGKVGVWLRS
ncbi:hypothetical protein INR49_006783 [Caranx melampygus]|nr:hypothetical protein INR49_006783 [Caranx melampygus]